MFAKSLKILVISAAFATIGMADHPPIMPSSDDGVVTVDVHETRLGTSEVVAVYPEGWNLLSVSGYGALDMHTLFATGAVSSVYWYDGGTKTWDLFNDGDIKNANLLSTGGYWVKVKSEKTLQIRYLPEDQTNADPDFDSDTPNMPAVPSSETNLDPTK